MSQERTRFPIQPDERRRSALSSRDVKAVPDEPVDAVRGKRRKQADKPGVPPHERHDRDRREDHPDHPPAGEGEAAVDDEPGGDQR